MTLISFWTKSWIKKQKIKNKQKSGAHQLIDTFLATDTSNGMLNYSHDKHIISHLSLVMILRMISRIGR